MSEKILTGQCVLDASEALASLTIAEGAVVTAPEGKRVILTVDGARHLHRRCKAHRY